MPPLDDTGQQPPPFDPSKPFTPASQAVAPPPFDPSKPFSAAPAAAPTPQWTKDNPLRVEYGKTSQADIDAAPWTLWPGEKEPVQQKAKPAPEQNPEQAIAPDTQLPYDRSAFPPPPAPPGMLSEAWRGLERGAASLFENTFQRPANLVEQHVIVPIAAAISPAFGKYLAQQAQQDASVETEVEKRIADATAPGVGGLSDIGGVRDALHYAAGKAGEAIPTLLELGLTHGAGLSALPVFGAQGAIESGPAGYEKTGSVPAALAGAGAGAALNLAAPGLIGETAGLPLGRAIAQTTAGMMGVGAVSPLAERLPEAITARDISRLFPSTAEEAEAIASSAISGTVFGGVGALGQRAPQRRSTVTPAAEAPPAAPAAPPQGAPDIGEPVNVAGYPGPMKVDAYPAPDLVRVEDADGVKHTVPVTDVAPLIPPEAAPQVSPTAAEPAPAPPVAGEAPGTFRTVTNVNGQEQVVEGPTPTPTVQAPAPPNDALDDLWQKSEGEAVAQAQQAAAPVAPLPPSPEDQRAAQERAKLAAISGEGGTGAAPPPLSPGGTETEPTAGLPTAPPEPIPQPTVPPQAAPQPASDTTGLRGMGNAMGQGIVSSLYNGLFDALKQGKTTFAGMRDPVLIQARAAFERGEIQSPEDLENWVATEYQKPQPAIPPQAVQPEPPPATVPETNRPITPYPAAPAPTEPPPSRVLRRSDTAEARLDGYQAALTGANRDNVPEQFEAIADEWRRGFDAGIVARSQPPSPSPTEPPAPSPPPLSAEPRNPRDVGTEIAKAREETNPDPTDAQKESGNYAKGRVNFHGLPFVMETPEGEMRRGIGPDGTPWEVEMPVDYGYLARSEGADGEHVDAYLGPHPESHQVYVIDQIDANTKAFDEHKVMLGFNSWPEAREAYQRAFSDDRGPERIGNVTPMTLSEVKTWLRDGDTKNPIGQGAFAFENINPPAPAVGTPTEAKAPPFQLADAVTAHLGTGKNLSARDLQRMAEQAFGGTLADKKFTRDQMYDALELGVNQHVQSNPAFFNPRAPLREAVGVARDLESLKNQLPTQTVRAGEKDRFQQFSTPPDYAYAAAWLADIRPEDRILEPSAGTGSLVAAARNAGPSQIVANDLFLPRAEMVKSLGADQVHTENAEQLHNILPPEVRPSLVLMNPPFSATAGRMGEKTVLMTGARHIDQALARLEPGGRLIAIVGRGMTMDAPTFRDWWAKTSRDYDVRANIGVPGSVYQKYGTNFATRLLVIDKVPPSGRPIVGGNAASLPEAMERLDAVRQDRPAQGTAGEQLAAEPSGAEVAAPASPTVGVGPAIPGPTPVRGVRGEPADTGAGPELPSRPGAGIRGALGSQPQPGPGNEVVLQQPERPGGLGAEPNAPVVPGAGEVVGGGGTAPNGVVLRPEGGAGPVLPAGGEPSGVEKTPEEIAAPAPETVKVDEIAAEPTAGGGVTEAVYEPYKPQRISIEGAQPHPGNLVQSAAMASVMPPMVEYSPRLPKEQIANGTYSDAQLEAITYAGYAHSKILPANAGATPYRGGYFIGDGTGVGKGREIAGVIHDNFNQGRQKALWISESKTLLQDATRDWMGTGGQKTDLFDLSKVKAGADVKAARGIGFLTYDTLKSAERVGKDAQGKTIKGQRRIDQLIKWLGPDFDGVIAFDESHNLANAIAQRDTRGVKDAAQKALAGIELQQKLPNARVVYVSATGATEVANLAYAERLGLWGRGTAFPDKNAFINSIGSGGIAAMELVARDMKAMGSYVSRNLSYDDVKYDRLEHALTSEQKTIYNGLAEGWQNVLRNINAALAKTGPMDDNGEIKPSKEQRRNAIGAFWSGHQRFFNQIITSMQMPSVIKAIEGDLKEGRQAVLQLVNTNEAPQKRALAKRRGAEGVEGEDLYEDLDLTPRDQLAQMIDKSFPTQQMEKYTDEVGNERVRGVTDSQGRPVHNPEAVAMKEALLEKVGSLSVPDGPLEMLLNHFGPDKVAEVTGRKERIVKIPDKNGVVRATPETRGANTNAAEADAFQNGKKKILVFSQAGGTGRSYHADLTSPSAGAQRSHYLVQAGWRADKAIQGFGRTHRTNQGSAPIFHLVTTDLQGQRRFISSIARRLSQLGALTKGERRAGDQGLFSARDNLESPEATAALNDFWRALQRDSVQGIEPRDFEQQTGLSLANQKGEWSNPPEIPQFLNRLLSLKYDMQNYVFGEFDRRLTDAVDRAAANGTLDTGTETLKGDRINKEDEKTVYTDPQSGAETKYVRLKVDTKNKPATFDQVDSGKRMTAGRIPVTYVQSKTTGKVFAVSEASLVTRTDGSIREMYRLSDPLKWDYTERNRLVDDRYWQQIDNERQARELWDKQVAALPEYTSRDVHLITGAVLPIWDRLQGSTKVFRLQTDAGERMLGRVVDDKHIDQTLMALGTEAEARSYAPQEVADRIMQGDRATLANGWTLKRSMVAGEPRIELIGPNYTHNDELSRAGAYSERIQYNTRYFIPTGEQAAPTLERILERRPVTQMTGTQQEGLAQEAPRGWESVGPGEEPIRAGEAQSTLRDARALHETGDYPEGLRGAHEAARDYVWNNGLTTGNEYFASVGPEGRLIAAGTSDHPGQIRFSQEMRDQVWDPNQPAAGFHHNHPTVLGDSLPLSVPDLTMLAAPGVGSVTAHSHDGQISSASLTPRAREFLADLSPKDAQTQIREIALAAEETAREAIDPMLTSRQIRAADANALVQEARNQYLAAAGWLDHITTRELPDWLRDHLAQSAARDFGEAEGGTISDRLYRAAGPLLPEDAMAGISRAHAEVATGRRAGEGSRGAGAQSAGETRAAADAALASGLAEERPSDFSDRAIEETIEKAAAGSEGGGGRDLKDKLQADMGALQTSPGYRTHSFNFVNRWFTFPRVLAALDSRWNAKWTPEMAKHRDATVLLNKYKEGLSSWSGSAKEDRDAVVKAAEILTLQSRDVPIDGRPIIAENIEHPLAAHSNVGDIVRLDTPQRIKMFTDLRNTMDQVFSDLKAGVGKQLGWEGEPTSRAILEAAETAPDAQKRQLQRAARIIQAIEYKYRTSYVPLMRQGDYYFRVTPKEGTPDKPGIEGWDGNGSAPTTLFKLIESRSWLEQAKGGELRGTPKLAQAELENLQTQFSPAEYDIDHGYMFRNEDTIRNLKIPAVEKLMTLVGSDVRDQLSRSLGVQAGKDAYNRVIDDVLDQVASELSPLSRENIQEARLAGFRRPRANTPGYDGDLTRSIGRYVHWLSSYTADLPYRAEIEAADQALTQHPNPRVQQYARDWDRRNEDSYDQMAGPLMRLRQANFYWLLGMNAATTAKIALHGPLLGVPVLTTGLGARGRSMAAAAYLNAARQVGQGIRIGSNGLEIPDITHGVTDPRERAFLQNAEARGITHPHGADEMAAASRGGEKDLTEPQRLARRVATIWASNVSMADRLIRAAMLRAAYRTAQREGMDAINKVWDRDLNWRNAPEKTPETFAEMMVDRTAGIWGDMNRLPALRSQLGGMLGQYRNYELNYLSNLYNMTARMGPEGKITAGLMLAGLGSLGGAAALPFVQDAEKATEAVWKFFGDQKPDLQADFRNWIDSLGIWDDAGNDVIHGVRPLGIDLGSGIGFGDVISRNVQSPLDFAGAAISSFAGGAQRAYQAWNTGQGELATVRWLAPNAVKHGMDAVYPEAGLTSASGYTKIGRPEDMSDADKIKVGLGFRLASRAQQFEHHQENQNAIANNHQALDVATARVANLRDRGQDSAQAEADINRLIAEGVRLGIYQNFASERRRINNDLRRMARQRANPQQGSRTMQRMDTRQQSQAQPAP